MTEYSVFWIEEEFFSHYYYRSDILFRFIRDYQYDGSRIDLCSQFHFITRYLPYTSLVTHIKRYHSGSLEIHIEGNRIRLKNNFYSLVLSIHKKQLVVRCPSLENAECLLFEPLRSFHPSLFIIEKDLKNYGWIATRGKRKCALNYKRLYSLL